LIESTGIAVVLTRGLLLAATVALALLSGFGFSPAFDSVDYMLGKALRGYPYLTLGVINAYVTPLTIAVMTLAIAGIPAAVYERIRGHKSSTAVSLAIWLVVAGLLALPAILHTFVSGDELR
jgi:hypothetical protein